MLGLHICENAFAFFYFVRARQFVRLIMLRHHYRAFNAIFGRIGRNGSVEAIMQLIRSKCIPCLLYASEPFPVNECHVNALDFSISTMLGLTKSFKPVDVIKHVAVLPHRGHQIVHCQMPIEISGKILLFCERPVVIFDEVNV